MKLNSIKHLLCAALAVLSVCLSTGCKKKIIPPNTTYTTGGATSDSTTVKIDSLPTFYSPAGIALDAEGNIYVADYGNNMIRKITPGGLVSTLAGSGNQGNINAAGNLASFNKPSGLAVDAGGNVYVADAGNSLIRQIASSGLVTTFAGGDTTGTLNGPAAAATFFYPMGIALDASGNMYVADAGNNLIRMINTAATVSTFAGSVTDSSSNILNNPAAVAADAHGNVFVANYLANTILEYNSGGALTLQAGTGSSGAVNGAATAATFFNPGGVTADAAGNIYVADGVNNLIRKITPDGMVSTFAGNGTAGAVDSTAANASFNGPSGIAVDNAGNVYVADTNNNLIRKITPAGLVTTVAGNGLAGARNGQAAARHNKLLRSSASRLKIFIKKPAIHS